MDDNSSNARDHFCGALWEYVVQKERCQGGGGKYGENISSQPWH